MRIVFGIKAFYMINNIKAAFIYMWSVTPHRLSTLPKYVIYLINIYFSYSWTPTK